MLSTDQCKCAQPSYYSTIFAPIRASSSVAYILTGPQIQVKHLQLLTTYLNNMLIISWILFFITRVIRLVVRIFACFLTMAYFTSRRMISIKLWYLSIVMIPLIKIVTKIICSSSLKSMFSLCLLCIPSSKRWSRFPKSNTGLRRWRAGLSQWRQYGTTGTQFELFENFWH